MVLHGQMRYEILHVCNVC